MNRLIEKKVRKVRCFCGLGRQQYAALWRPFGLFLVGVISVTGVQGENFRLGALTGTLGFEFGVEYIDNVNSSETDPKSDIKLNSGPTLNLQLPIALEFSGGEAITLGTSFHYSRSVLKTDNDRFDAPCNFSIMIPVYVYEWHIVLSEAFTFSNDPLETTFAFNRTKLPQYNNTVGVTGTRNFGKAALTLATSRNDQLYPDDPQQEETSYQFSVTPSFYFRENYSIFWANSVGINLPADKNKPSSTTYSTSIGVSGQITDSISGSVSIGYAHSRLRSVKLGPGNGIFGGIFDPDFIPSDNFDGPSAQLAMNYTHPLRPNTTYNMSFQYTPGITTLLKDSNIQSMSTVNFRLAHNLTRSLTLAPQVTFSHIEDVGNRGAGEKANLINLTFGLSRAFTQHFTGGINYSFQSRMSNLDGQSYDVNRITLSVNYTF